MQGARLQVIGLPSNSAPNFRKNRSSSIDIACSQRLFETCDNFQLALPWETVFVLPSCPGKQGMG